MLSLLLLALASAPPAAPDALAVLDVQAASRLARRTGFSARPDEVTPLVGLHREAAVDRLLSQMTTTARTPLPTEVTSALSFPAPDPRDAAAVIDDVANTAGIDPADLKKPGKALLAHLGQKGLALKSWWMGEMVTTTSPLTERVTLVLHDHFTSSMKKVKDPRLMAKQNALLRAHAGGSFANLLHGIIDDAAMLRYLDASGSDKAAPNENLAREFLELFTLGEGHYTEDDVKAAARALTGRQVRRFDGEVTHRRRLRDHGDKTFLGVSGDLGPHDIVDRLLAHHRTAITITEKVWTDFIGDDVDDARVAAIAAVFRESGYDMKVLLRGIMLEEAFWRPTPGVVVMPVALVVSAAREVAPLLDGDAGSVVEREQLRPEALVIAARTMGQDLLDPPSVKGWPGGRQLVTTATIAPRDRFLHGIARALEDAGHDDAADRLMHPAFQTR